MGNERRPASGANHRMLRRYTSLLLLHMGSRITRLDIFGMRRFLARAESWTPAQRRQWRLQRLGDILEFAWREVPFYREFWGDHGVDFHRPTALEELESYPVLTKQIFRENSRRIVARTAGKIRHINKQTGGSTSLPVQYLLDIEQWSLIQGFHMWGWEQSAYRPGDAVGVIAGGSLVPDRRSFKSRLQGYANRRLFLYGVAMDAALAREYHRRLVKYGAEYLYGYPSILFLFAQHLRDAGLTLPQVKGIVTTAEMLLPHYRQTIEGFFGLKVFNNFGSNDGGLQSYECARHEGLHYNDLQCVLEVEGADASGVGRALITNLWNRSTPFIRYENGDLVALGRSPCPCGHSFPLIASVQGRTADILSFACGRSLSGPALTLMFGDMKIDGWQIVQTGANRLEVRICSPVEPNPEYLQRINHILDFHLKGDVDVRIVRVNSLELTAGGKLKPVWVKSTA